MEVNYRVQQLLFLGAGSGGVGNCILRTRVVHARKRTCICDSIQSVDDDNRGNYGVYHSL
jgi:hypothetical protein